MVWELCSSGAAVRKAGLNANAITASSAAMTEFYDEAVGQLKCRTRFNWAGTSNVSDAVKDAVSDLIAIKIITYDPNSWQLATAQTKIDALKNNSDVIIKQLSDTDSNSLRTP